MPRVKTREKKGRKRKMSELIEANGEAPKTAQELDMLKERKDKNTNTYFAIEGQGDGTTVHITLKAPKVAAVVRKMVVGNYLKSDIDKVFHPILQLPIYHGREKQPGLSEEEHKKKEAEYHKTHCRTVPGISKATKCFDAQAAGQFSFDNLPPAVLLYNPDMLEAGYTLVVKLDKPTTDAALKKWGKSVIDGISEIIKAAKPFKMTWAAEEDAPSDIKAF